MQANQTRKNSVLSLKDVIETLTIYDIKHTIFPHNYIAGVNDNIPIIRGVALRDRKLILLDEEQNMREMRGTVIHELIHAKYYKLGNLRKNVERIVDGETKRTFMKLYGVEP